MKNHGSSETTPRLGLATFHRPGEAEKLKAYLLKKGIEAEIKDERRLQRFWFHVPQKAGIHVMVCKYQMEAARQLLESHYAEGTVLKKAIRCPACSSTRVQFPAITRKNLLPALAAHLLQAVHIMDPEYF